MRDNNWLEKLLDEIWQNHFADIEKINPIKILFSKKAKRRLGTISVKKISRLWQKQSIGKDDQSIITINGHFKNEQIPVEIIRLTIAHELVHYAHGFSSAHKQNLKYPHKGRVVEKELIDRGLGSVLKLQENWMKKNWVKFLAKEAK